MKSFLKGIAVATTRKKVKTRLPDGQVRGQNVTFVGKKKLGRVHIIKIPKNADTFI